MNMMNRFGLYAGSQRIPGRNNVEIVEMEDGIDWSKINWNEIDDHKGLVDTDTEVVNFMFDGVDIDTNATDVSFSAMMIGEAKVQPFLPIVETRPKKIHVVVDGLNLVLGIQSIINKNAHQTGYMDMRMDTQREIKDHFISTGAEIRRVFDIMVDFFNIFPKATIHLVFKKMGSEQLWSSFCHHLNEAFLESESEMLHKYQIYITEPNGEECDGEECDDEECDDRMANILAQRLSSDNGNQVHLLSNDYYRSLPEHLDRDCYYEKWTAETIHEDLVMSKPENIGFIDKCRFEVLTDFTSDRLWNISCKLK